MRNDLTGGRVADVALELANHLDALVAYWDIRKVCVFANDAYRNWFGKPKEEVVGRTMEELLGPLYAKNLPFILAAYEGQTQVFEREVPGPNGITRHSLATYTPHIVDGEVRGIFVHVADVSRLKLLEQELRAARASAEHLATHDFLTGLPNRVLLLDRIATALALANRNRRIVAAISFDIDDFKKVNDVHGHGAGDQLLIQVASRTKAVLRESDTVTRMGGDEFFVLAPDIESMAMVETLVGRLLKEGSRPLEVEGAAILPTLSAGIAVFPQNATTPEDLIASSDRALYVAKRQGKNRHAFADQQATTRPRSPQHGS